MPLCEMIKNVLCLYFSIYALVVSEMDQKLNETKANRKYLNTNFSINLSAPSLHLIPTPFFSQINFLLQNPSLLV